MARSTEWPHDVGILAVELIFPHLYVDQSDLEVYDGVSQGKYTVGLGQSKMGFCTDRDDINSLCLTVVTRLMERNSIAHASVGRLEVGTETIVDKSKSVKSVLMQIFEEHGNFSIEGIDTTNACYGGTAALFNAVSWIESSAWDGRLAIVVAADIALYAKGNARPTGGAGAVAMLVGPDAPLVIERGLRSTYMRHVYDFYKPNLESEYPVVDGKLSIQCYLSALDNCYQMYCDKAGKVMQEKNQFQWDVNCFDSILFHSPYCKLVQKSLARLVLIDFVRAQRFGHNESFIGLEKFANVKLEDTYFDKDIEKEFLVFSKECFKNKTEPSLFLANQIGNMYTPSLYGGLVSLLLKKPGNLLAGTRIGLFSYGSGLASSFFSIKVSDDSSVGSKLDVLVRSVLNVQEQLDLRLKVSPEDFSKILEDREKNHHVAPYTPSAQVDNFFPGSWYLKYVDDKYRRYYDRVPLS
ncbi:hydroxymethylglutaryl-CoA synthase 1-like [Ischnura elegans]|uniref:hydroxymethylglutaryl-CoA synthase 1-like n=1 Tax=Ischnura elegans TaxID=197161 RepID=UPI001ED8A8C4|nr:hydroxymethylglutaryl-CoA synthase 1-like [Ischnura elegans]XP_046394200.1 hydroxymethylglutaryl-CoA synthase 1-like [Ischnura elegans]